ncbi:MAG: ATP-binding protein [Candidatus Thermoplasmatota archaeon]|nr:ATP-binding protein [Candidatus Thermoplasmatota archaeon]
MLGRIIGRNVGEIVFRYPYGEEVKLGEILVAEDAERETLFFLRVVDLRYGQEGSEQWGLRTAGEMMMLDDMEQPYRLRDRERRLFKIGVCSPLGYVAHGRFRRPKALPAHFSPVRRATPGDYAFLEEAMGEVEVGWLRSGEQVVEVAVGLPLALLTHHVGIFATTGMGKSNLMRVMAASIMDHGGCGLLIVDPHGEYCDGGGDSRGLRQHPRAGERLVVYSPHRLRGPHNSLLLSAAEITVGDLQNLFSFSDAQRDALHALAGRFGREWLLRLCQTEVAELVYEFDQRIHESTFGVLQRRGQRILDSDIVHADAGVEATQAMVEHLDQGKVVLVDTSGLYEYEELLVGVVLARKVLGWRQRVYRDRERFASLPPVLLTMEEAQRVLREGEGIFARIAREGRKFKVGLCAITQQPKLIKPELLSQFNTFCILGLADEGDRGMLRSAAKQDLGSLDREIQTLEAGEALITYPGAPFALPARIHWYDHYLERREERASPRDSLHIDRDFY